MSSTNSKSHLAVTRCWWCGDHDDYIAYHDDEWGRPSAETRRLFEKICLEGFQAGLSWLTILRKRDNFRAAFHNFEAHQVAMMTDGDVESLLQDAGIVRHRAKILSVINNAKRLPELEAEFGSLGAFVWSFEPDASERPDRCTREAIGALAKTPASTALSKALKKRGWSFVGPTTMYAFMQSCGVVNDHVEGCFARPLVRLERATFKRPKVI